MENNFVLYDVKRKENVYKNTDKKMYRLWLETTIETLISVYEIFGLNETDEMIETINYCIEQLAVLNGCSFNSAAKQYITTSEMAMDIFCYRNEQQKNREMTMEKTVEKIMDSLKDRKELMKTGERLAEDRWMQSLFDKGDIREYEREIAQAVHKGKEPDAKLTEALLGCLLRSAGYRGVYFKTITENTLRDDEVRKLISKAYYEKTSPGEYTGEVWETVFKEYENNRWTRQYENPSAETLLRILGKEQLNRHIADEENIEDTARLGAVRGSLVYAVRNLMENEGIDDFETAAKKLITSEEILRNVTRTYDDICRAESNEKIWAEAAAQLKDKKFYQLEDYIETLIDVAGDIELAIYEEEC